MTTSTDRRRAGALVVAGLSMAGLVGMAVWPSAAFAGMGAVLPHYKPKPCSGDACRADDPRSNSDCKGLLCSFSSSKAMQPPVTAAQAAEAERARAAAEAAQAQQAVAAPMPDTVAPKKKRRVAKAKAKVPTELAADTKTPAEPASAAH